MKIAIMSDVHANPMAFNTAIQDAEKRGVDEKLLLGDIVGYGYDPSQCIKLAKDNFDVILKGNHDAAVVGELPLGLFNPTAATGVVRCESKITHSEKEWLRNAPYLHIDIQNRFIATHGTVFSPEKFEYLDNTFSMGMEIKAISKGKLKEANGCRIVFCGHTHHSGVAVFSQGARFEKFVRDSSISLDYDKYYVVNVGSVGYPRVEHSITYAIYDTAINEIEIIKLPFDFGRYVRCLEMNGIQIPNWLDMYLGEENGEM